MKRLNTLSVLLAIMLSIMASRAQEKADMNFPIHPIYYTVFDKDSLKGFDENAARAAALSQGFFGSEFKIRMYDLKREYIDSKYNLRKQVSPAMTLDDYLMATRPAAVPGCVNEDFEASAPGQITTANQINGWTIMKGYNGNPTISPPAPATIQPYYQNWQGGNVNSCNLISCCPVPPSHSELIDCSAPGGYIDNQVGAQYPIFSVFGSGAANAGAKVLNPQLTMPMYGTKVLRLNDGITQDRSIERLSKTFAVTPQNALFQFAFISVFAPDHDCCTAGGFLIKLTNATANTVIPCPQFSVSAPSNLCLAGPAVPKYKVGTSGVTYTFSGGQNNAGGNAIYNPWQINSMDLTAYIGQNITIDIIVSDCTAGGHYGKVYFDAQCGPMKVYGNGTEYDAGSNVTVPTCGAAGATICAADGLGPYSWAGPGLPPGASVPSMTNQCIVTNVSAQYTLYMQPAGACVPIERIVNSTVTPAPLVAVSVVQATCGTTKAVVTATPSGSAATPSELTWSPIPFNLSSNTIQATYNIPPGPAPMTVTLLAVDPLGCKVTATANINPAPPIPTFTLLNLTSSTSLTCNHPYVNLEAQSTYTYNGNTLNYFWSSNSSTFAAQNVSVVVPGTYTVRGYDPVTFCEIQKTVTIGQNIALPSSTLSPSLQNITCNVNSIQTMTLVSSPTVNITHQIISPCGGLFSSGAHIATYLPGCIGVYTYQVKDEINGCITAKQFTITSADNFPKFSVNSPQNFTLGCGTRSCTQISIDNADAQGSPISYTVVPPGSPDPAPTGSLSGSNVYTVCAAGNYVVITRNNNTGCQTKVPVTILQNTFTPHADAIVVRQVLDCNTPSVTLKGWSQESNVEFSWMFQGIPNTVQGETITAMANYTAASTRSLVNTYTLVVNNLSSTCKSTKVIPIYQNLYPPVAIVSTGVSGTASLTCLTHSIELFNFLSHTSIPPSTGFPASGPIVAKEWNGPSPQEPKYYTSSYIAQVPGIYTLTVQDVNNGCVNTATAAIVDNRVYPDPAPSMLTGTLDCGSSQTSIKVDLTIPGPYSYSWSPPPGAVTSPVTNPKLDVADIGEYGVLITNTINGCMTPAAFTVINGTLTANFTADQVQGNAPLAVNLTNLSTSTTGTTNIRSMWHYGNGTTSGTLTPTGTFVISPVSGSVSPQVIYTQPGTYKITMYAIKGSCLDTAFAYVKVDIPSAMQIPNVFTPNKDGVNDLFFVKSSNLAQIDAVIVDRWGKIVYQVNSDTGNIEWDGKNAQGKDAAEGTYFYSIKALGKDGQSYDKNGTINLYR